MKKAALNDFQREYKDPWEELELELVLAVDLNLPITSGVSIDAELLVRDTMKLLNELQSINDDLEVSNTVPFPSKRPLMHHSEHNIKSHCSTRGNGLDVTMSRKIDGQNFWY